MTDIERSTEVTAFLDALRSTAAETVSACDGWTAHEVTAHLTAAAAEVTSHLRAWLAGEPVPETRAFEEREPPYRAMADEDLRHRLDVEERTVRAALGQVLAAQPDAVIPWTGRRMPVATFLPHLRSEFAVHRWDIVGDDELGTELLAQPDLTEHAVGALGGLLVARGSTRDPEPGRDLHVRLRSGDSRDVRLVVESGVADLRLAEQADEPRIDLDAAARTLVIWGRRPADPARITSHVDPPTLARVLALLSGY